MANAYGVAGSHIFITGGAGFIGTTLASKLVDDNRITLFDNLHNDALSNTLLKSHPNVEFIKGDVLNAKQLAESMAPSVDYVIHCAAIAGVDTVVNNPLKTLEVNLLGVFHALQGASKLPNLKRFVDFSTSEVYGQRAYNVHESLIHPQIVVGEPRWTYSISKLAGEFVTHSYHVQYGTPTVTIRPFNVYGPNQVGVGAIHHFVIKALKGDDLTIHNDGMQIRAWCYIEDFVDGVLLAMTRTPVSGRSYNIGNPQSSLTTLALARLVNEVVGGKSKLEFKRLTYPDVELRIPDISAARSELGFCPQVDIKEGIERTVAWYREHRSAAARKAA
jgi:nucleoside-diphosphate-sugar epimerase